MLCLQCGILQNEIKAKIITGDNKKSAQKFCWNKIKYYICTIKNKTKQQDKKSTIMAKYTVKFACGHEEVINLYGSHAERERKIAYYQQHGKCSECYKAEKKAEKETEASKIEDMPELQGTEKQVSWANDIRNKMAAEVVEYIESKVKTDVKTFSSSFAALNEEQKAFVVRKSEAVAKYATLITETSAKYYIENR